MPVGRTARVVGAAVHDAVGNRFAIEHIQQPKVGFVLKVLRTLQGVGFDEMEIKEGFAEVLPVFRAQARAVSSCAGGEQLFAEENIAESPADDGTGAGGKPGPNDVKVNEQRLDASRGIGMASESTRLVLPSPGEELVTAMTEWGAAPLPSCSRVRM